MDGLVVNRGYKRITNPYGSGHNGVDIGWSRNEADNKVYANSAGEVFEVVDGHSRNPKASGASSWGNYVLVRHANGMFTRYAHLKKGVLVKKGQRVDENTLLGIMGDSGKTTARHLHFEVSTGYSSTTRIDPTPYLTRKVIANGVSYQAYDLKKGYWLPSVLSGTGHYAGNKGNAICCFRVKTLTYQAHDMVKGYWLPWVTGDVSYAGNKGNPIDAIRIKGATYRTYDNVKGKFLPSVHSLEDYAGNMGHAIGAIEILSVDE